MAAFRGDLFRFDSTDPEWMKDLVEPVAFLSRRNLHLLRRDEYVVSPKADGQRMLLLCENDTFDLYLIHPITPGPPPQRLDGKYVGPKDKSAGFLLDTEVVEVGSSGLKIILAFDILSMAGNIQVEDDLFTAWDIERQEGVPCIDRRHQLLEYIVQNLTVKGLSSKPIRPAHEACQMFQALDNLPYPTDGLIFTPRNQWVYRGCRTLKWKPTNELTLDVAVGGPIEGTASTTSFIAHLRDDPGIRHVQIKTARDVVSFGHLPLRLQHPGGAFGTLSATEEFDTGVLTKHRKHTAGTPCDADCPCKESFASEGQETIKLYHCPKCGALCLAHTALAKSTCKIACVGNDNFRGLPTAVEVDVPNECAEWAKHSIIEVFCENVSTEGISLKFKRLRRDKRHANDVDVANTIRGLILDPIDLSKIRYRMWTAESQEGISKPFLGLELQATGRYRIPTEAGQRGTATSGFMRLRFHHFQIKGWLYRTFGGKNIIDACSGGLYDIQNWFGAGFGTVLAVEKDPELCEIGRSRLEELDPALTETQVILVEADLSVPIDLAAYASPGCQSLDSVFCNFAIHYFWETREQSMCFLSNLTSTLDPGGRFVVTYLQGDKLRERGNLIQIYNENGQLEFSAKALEGESNLAEVYVASIGIPHRESIMTLDEMKYRFNEAGLDLVASFPFSAFEEMLPSGSSLSKEEMRMSNLFAVVVFEKRGPEAKVDDQVAIFPGAFPPSIESKDLESEVMSFLDIPDLLKSRRVCKTWKIFFDYQFEIPTRTRRDYFDGHVIQFDPLRGRYFVKSGVVATPLALSLYLRMGGDAARRDINLPDDDSAILSMLGRPDASDTGAQFFIQRDGAEYRSDYEDHDQRYYEDYGEGNDEDDEVPRHCLPSSIEF